MLEIKDKENFEQILKTITKHISFDCSQYSETFITRRIEVRLRANGMDLFSEYNALLLRSAEEREKLSKELSIHVTNFFRDKEMWTVFRDEVIPMVLCLKKEKKQTRINVWSAGCSTGEESLTIAICFLENGASNFNITIIGTDIDASTIEKAKAGEYEEQQFREMEPRLKEKYFIMSDEGMLKVKPELLKMIQYKIADIHIFRPQNADIILCRNTVIYFSMEAKSKLYIDFYKCLNKGGFFIMGKTEILQGEAREKFQIFNTKERIYFKE